jgi:hypothetical protein
LGDGVPSNSEIDIDCGSQRAHSVESDALFSSPETTIDSRTSVSSSPGGCHEESDDDDLPSLEEVFRTALRPKVSTEASKAERALHYLKQPALDRAGIQFEGPKSGLSERQGDSPGRRSGWPSY